MIEYSVPKASKTQDRYIVPDKTILNEMKKVDVLPISKHEVYFLETKDYFYYYSIDPNMQKLTTSCYIQLHKKLHSYAIDTRIKDYPQIAWTYSNTSYSGKDIALEMYLFLLRKYDGIWSDVKHSIGAKKLWIKLSNHARINLFDASKNEKILEHTYDPISDKWYSKKEYMLLAVNVSDNK